MLCHLGFNTAWWYDTASFSASQFWALLLSGVIARQYPVYTPYTRSVTAYCCCISLKNLCDLKKILHITVTNRLLIWWQDYAWHVLPGLYSASCLYSFLKLLKLCLGVDRTSIKKIPTSTRLLYIFTFVEMPNIPERRRQQLYQNNYSSDLTDLICFWDCETYKNLFHLLSTHLSLFLSLSLSLFLSFSLWHASSGTALWESLAPILRVSCVPLLVFTTPASSCSAASLCNNPHPWSSFCPTKIRRPRKFSRLPTPRHA